MLTLLSSRHNSCTFSVYFERKFCTERKCVSSPNLWWTCRFRAETCWPQPECSRLTSDHPKTRPCPVRDKKMGLGENKPLHNHDFFFAFFRKSCNTVGGGGGHCTPSFVGEAARSSFLSSSLFKSAALLHTRSDLIRGNTLLLLIQPNSQTQVSVKRFLSKLNCITFEDFRRQFRSYCFRDRIHSIFY